MGRKGTATATKMKDPVRRIYAVGLDHGERLDTIEFLATRIEEDMESIHIYDIILGKEEKVGCFSGWVYYILIDVVEENEDVTKHLKRPSLDTPILPPNWGKVDGKVF